MTTANDWLFEIIWDLSDKANAAKMPRLAEKLEEAMDTYLSEALGRKVGLFDGRFSHQPAVDNPHGRTSHRCIRLSSDLRAKLTRPKSDPGIADRRPADRPDAAKIPRKSDVTFAWPL